jgi:signal transduction histidine kinase
MTWERSANNSTSSRRMGLVYIIATRLFIVIVLCVTIESGLWIGFYLRNEELVNIRYTKYEISQVVKSILVSSTGIIYNVDQKPYSDDKVVNPAYAFRVFDPNGHIVAASNAQLLETLVPTSPGFDFWLRDLDPAKWFYIVGGAKTTVGNSPLTVEVAILGDPELRHLEALFYDFVESAAIPVATISLLTVLYTCILWRKQRKFLATADTQLEAIPPHRLPRKLDTAGMPADLAAFVESVNRVIERAQFALDSRENLVSFAVHELRRPLAVMLMEAARITDARARRLESDIADMADVVGRMLTMARIDATPSQPNDPVDLATIVAIAVERLRPVAQRRRCQLTVTDVGTGPMSGDASSILEALSNLIENAIKHTPEGTTVRIQCGPGRRLAVEDSGPGVEGREIERLLEPFQRGKTTSEGTGLGLAIVKRSVDLHGGALEVGRSALGGARFRLVFE